MLRRLLSSVVEIRPEEIRTAVLMFTYSFAAMTAYNIVQPVTRSAFITTLGADNIPYVLFATGLLIGFIMQFYSRLLGRLPRRWAIPIVLLGLTGLLLTFWMLLREGSGWVSAGLLPLRAGPGHVAPQSVLDRGQRRLQPPAGAASLRLHRWRRESRGNGRIGSGGGSGGACRRRRVAAVQRGSAGRHSRCRRLHRAAGHTHRFSGAYFGRCTGGRTRRRLASDAGIPRSSADRRIDQLCGIRGCPDRPAAQYGGRAVPR